MSPNLLRIATFLLMLMLMFTTIALCITDTPWPMRGHDVMHTGQSPYKGPDTASVKWKFQTSFYVYSSPCIGSDGTVYAGSFDNNLYVINPDGALRWKFQTDDDVFSSPCIGSDGTVYVGSWDSNLYAINPDGTLRWKFKTGNPVFSSPCIGLDGTVYVGSYDYYLYAINPDSTLRWKFKTGNPVDSSPCIGSDGTVYVGSDDSYLYAISPDGTLRWKFKTSNPVFSSPCIGSDGTVYVGSADHYLYAIKPDGALRWKFQTGGWVYSSPCIGTNGIVYVGSWDNYLYAIKPDGALRWKFQTGSAVYSSPCIGSDGTVYVGSEDSYLYAIKPDGALRWKFKTGDLVYSSPCIGSDGMLYVGSRDSNIYALEKVPSPVIELSHKELDFGSVQVGMPQEMILTISNSGDARLSVSGISSSSPEFTVFVFSPSFILDAGFSKRVKATFTPSSAGSKSANLTIASNDPDNPSLSISLAGLATEPVKVLSYTVGLNIIRYGTYPKWSLVDVTLIPLGFAEMSVSLWSQYDDVREGIESLFPIDLKIIPFHKKLTVIRKDNRTEDFYIVLFQPYLFAGGCKWWFLSGNSYVYQAGIGFHCNPFMIPLPLDVRLGWRKAAWEEEKTRAYVTANVALGFLGASVKPMGVPLLYGRTSVLGLPPDGILQGGKTAKLQITVENRGDATARDVSLSIDFSDLKQRYFTFPRPFVIKKLGKNKREVIEVPIRTEENIPTGAVKLIVNGRDKSGYSFSTEPIELQIRNVIDPRLHYEKGITAFFNLGRYYEAAKEFNMAVMIEPDYQDALSKLKEIPATQSKGYMDKAIDASLEKDYEKSIRFMLKAVAVNPYKSDYRRQLKNAYTKGIDYLKDTADKASQLSTEAAAWEALDEGIDDLASGNLSLAEEKMREAIRRDSGYAIAYLFLGIVLVKKGAVSQAQSAFTKAIELDGEIEIPADIGSDIWKIFLTLKGESMQDIR